MRHIGKVCRRLQLPAVFTWHLLAWLGVSAFTVDGLRGVFLAALPVGLVLALLALIVGLRGGGPAIVMSSLEVHGCEDDTLRIPAVNMSLLILLLFLALLAGTGLGLTLDWLEVIEFSPFAFELWGRQVLLFPLALLALQPYLSMRSDAKTISAQLVDRHLVVRDGRGDRPRTLPPGKVTEDFVFDRLKHSAVFTCVLLVLLAGGLVAAFGLATAAGQQRRFFPLGDVGVIAVVIVAVNGIAALRDLVGTHYEPSDASEDTGYVAPGASVLSPRFGGLDAVIKSLGGRTPDE
jgi:hypothetical protein